MNRRNFIRNIMVAGAAFSILPGSGRIWAAKRKAVTVIPFWMQTIRSSRHFDSEYAKVFNQFELAATKTQVPSFMDFMTEAERKEASEYRCVMHPHPNGFRL